MCIHFFFDDTIVIFDPEIGLGHYVVGIEEGTYHLDITFTDHDETKLFRALDIATTSNVVHDYSIDWAALSRDEEGVVVRVDSDGDGVVDHVLTSDSELTAREFQGIVAVEGDLDENGIVDLFDLVTVVIAFGSTPSDMSWGARCDLNGDNVIDVFDLAIVAANFGKEQTPP